VYHQPSLQSEHRRGTGHRAERSAQRRGGTRRPGEARARGRPVGPACPAGAGVGTPQPGRPRACSRSEVGHGCVRQGTPGRDRDRLQRPPRRHVFGGIGGRRSVGRRAWRHGWLGVDVVVGACSAALAGTTLARAIPDGTAVVGPSGWAGFVGIALAGVALAGAALGAGVALAGLLVAGGPWLPEWPWPAWLASAPSWPAEAEVRSGRWSDPTPAWAWVWGVRSSMRPERSRG
jgi:hypothetical protein